MPAKKIAIVGAGAAGVFTAYQLRKRWGFQADITLLESSGRVGGNTYTVEHPFGGRPYSIDAGAQFFLNTAQPNYVSLLNAIGVLGDPAVITEKAVGISIWDTVQNERLMWVPSNLGGLGRYSVDDWGRLIKFLIFLVASIDLDDRRPTPWTLTTDNWLNDVKLDAEFKERVIKPFLYQFVTMPPGEVGDSSALYAVTYFARNAPADFSFASTIAGTPLFKTLQSLIGLDGILKRTLAVAAVNAQLNSPVTSIKRSGTGYALTAGGNEITAEHVVLAPDPRAACAMLKTGGTTDPELLSILERFTYGPLPLSIQAGGSCYMPSDQNYWEAVNTLVSPNSYTFSAYFGPLRTPSPAGGGIQAFKSWASPALSPANCQHQFLGHQHYVVKPTIEFMKARAELGPWQGRDKLWFAGGWSTWFDSQEACMLSALAIANSLQLHGAPLPAFDSSASGGAVPESASAPAAGEEPEPVAHAKGPSTAACYMGLCRMTAAIKNQAPEHCHEQLDGLMGELDHKANP